MSHDTNRARNEAQHVNNITKLAQVDPTFQPHGSGKSRMSPSRRLRLIKRAEQRRSAGVN